MVQVIRTSVQRTRLERRKAAVAEELRRLNTELVDELTTKEHMAELGHVSSEFFHDLRNPLTVVQGYAHLLGEQLDGIREQLGEDSGETFEYLSGIEHNVRRCTEIIEMWRNLGRKDAVQRREPVHVGELVRDVARGMEAAAVSAGAAMETSGEDCTCEILADGLQIFRALQNLVGNALQALPGRDGRVRVSCCRREGDVILEVEDNGHGIPADELEQIFKPYFTTKEAGQGTGLGLAITKKVIENHGGSIEVVSEVGKGTLFTVRLPVHGSAVPA
jgi:signal transduction histidine kinase